MGESKPETVTSGKTNSRNCKWWGSLYYLRHREIHGTADQRDTVLSKFYKHISLAELWDAGETSFCGAHGAIFNLEFSPCGEILVAACEKDSILIFDPLSQKLIKMVKDAHSACVNCVRFLDTRSFVTCSDDSTIALWDSRNLKSKVFNLEGHSNWVKSVEYHKPSGMLVTSAFDDTVRTWDVNRYFTSEGPKSRVVLNFSNLIRMKLTPDGSKMVISSIPGNLVVIHNLNLDYLQCDSEAFEHPTWWPSSERNSIELIQDFPEGCSPWCISSLDVHPHGWCTLSRCTCRRSRNEWTMLHDIQDYSEGPASCMPQRLTYTTQEPSVAKGYIKELCFSSDGRIICSPFGKSARLFSFNPECSELSKCLGNTPLELFELKTLISHKHAVVTCRFSPTHPLLSMGCLGGKVSFYQPHL